jgi:uncharacterized membrane protein
MPDIQPVLLCAKPRHPRHLLAVIALAVLFAVGLFPALLLAQTPGPVPPPVTALNLTTLATTALGLVAAVVVSAAQSGQIGIWAVSSAALPLFGLVGSVLVAAYGSLAAAGTLTSVSALNAFVAAVLAFVGYGTGAALHPKLATHFNLHNVTRAAIASAAKTAVAIVMVFAMLSGIAACSLFSPTTWAAVVSDLATIAQTVLADVLAGKPFAQVLADTGQEDATLLVTVLTGLITDPKTTPAYKAACQPYLVAAQALLAQQKAAAAKSASREREYVFDPLLDFEWAIQEDEDEARSIATWGGR